MCAGRIVWEDLVPRFRALRESLLSNSAPLPFFTEALEASSDACLRAGSFAEFLKSVQQLVLVSYPALAADDQIRQTSQVHTTCNPCLSSEGSPAVDLP